MVSARGLVSVCLVANAIGYSLAANLPQLFAAAILLLTPLAFLLSTARNCRQLADILALVLGLALFPLAATLHTGVDILISGSVGRHHRLWRSLVADARMSDFLGDWHSLLVLVIAGFLPNEVWRMLGLWLGGGVDEGSELLVWVRAVATAILAGVIAQILVQPPGALAKRAGLVARYGAVAAGSAAFIVTRRSIFAGVVCGELVMLGWQMVARLIESGNSNAPGKTA